MLGREFLDTADRLALGTSEADWRSAVSRAYYGLFIECRDALLRWKFWFPPRDAHREVQRRFSFPTNPDLGVIGKSLLRLATQRNSADYETTNPPRPFDRRAATDAIADARSGLAVLDALDTDPARRAAAIAAIRAAFP
jgi:uncharacterized protein (UPF0332 family)